MPTCEDELEQAEPEEQTPPDCGRAIIVSMGDAIIASEATTAAKLEEPARASDLADTDAAAEPDPWENGSEECGHATILSDSDDSEAPEVASTRCNLEEVLKEARRKAIASRRQREARRRPAYLRR